MYVSATAPYVFIHLNINVCMNINNYYNIIKSYLFFEHVLSLNSLQMNQIGTILTAII